MSSGAPRDALVIEVAVPIAVPHLLSYRAPAALGPVQVGARVLVPLGARKVSGVVVRVGAGEAPHDPRALADVLEILTEEPSLPAELVALALWIAEYYEASPGEVVRLQLPAGSTTVVRDLIATTAAGQEALTKGALPPRQRDLLLLLAKAPRPLAKLTAAQRRLAEELRGQGLLDAAAQRSARTKLRAATWASLTRTVADAEERHRRAPRRGELVRALAAGPLRVSELVERYPGSRAALSALVAAGDVVVTRQEDLRAMASPDAALAPGHEASALPTLTAEQRVAVEEIMASLGAGFSPFLIHGVTGSGKTEVYLRVIAEVLRRGATALVLVPEISLTPQLAGRFRARFGDAVAILHSGLSERDRLVEWQRLRRGVASIAVGARSAVFAPLSALGVIVIDEEHDGSFKQDDGVRYHARDVALVRAQRLGVPCILGSATPSLESYWQAQRGAYRLLTMTQRPTARPMPAVEIVDLRTFMPGGEDLLSAPLAAAVTAALAAGDQIILFLNRRGFATFVMCSACGHAFRCPHCAVSLTYHQSADRMLCHYCGFSQRVPEACPTCAAAGAIDRKGLGTERIAEAVAQRFPGARVARLDRDVAAGAKAEAILARVARREVDILVGTQMVTKGHDFPGVTLVGVLCADTGLNLPDFRASERTFQLLSQVAGRAGRGDRTGKVIIQTYRPGAIAVVAASRHDYEVFYRADVEERTSLGYPPAGRLIGVRVEGADASHVVRTAARVAELARRLAEELAQAEVVVEVLGPTPALIERLRGRTRWRLLLRGRDRQALRKVARAIAATEPDPGVRVGLDVDPISTL